jgi:hypothetical protein
MQAIVAGLITAWPSKDRMIAILREAGLGVKVGRYSLRIEDCSHFVFQQYGGDLVEPAIDADADTVEDMIRDATLVSDALSQAGVKHRFEIYDENRAMVGYLHHKWPLP